MDGRAFAQGIAGFNQGVEIGQAQVARQEAARRQAREDAWTAEGRDRQRKAWAAEDAAQELSARQRQLMARFGQVAAMGDNPTSAKAIMDLYNSIPDGQTITELPQRMEDGTWFIRHPVGELRGSWNEMMFGQTDPDTGAVIKLGLVHLIDPQLLLKNQQAVASELPKLARQRMGDATRREVADTRLKGTLATAASRERAAGISATSRERAAGISASSRAPATQVDENGNLVQWNGQAWVPASMADGTPLRLRQKQPTGQPKIVNAMGSDGVTRPHMLNPQTNRWEPIEGPNGPLEVPPPLARAGMPFRERMSPEVIRAATDPITGQFDEAKAQQILDSMERLANPRAAQDGGEPDELTLRPGEVPRQGKGGKWYIERDGKFYEVIP